MVRGREEVYFGHQFATKAATADAIGPTAVAYYVDVLRDPEALRASFEYCRAIDQIIEQSETRRQSRLDLPVLAVAGALACGELLANEMLSVADDVTSVIVPDCGHFVPEEAPEALLAALTEYLAPTRSASRRGSSHDLRRTSRTARRSLLQQVLLRPLCQLVQGRPQRGSVLGELVADPQRWAVENRAAHQPELDELHQPLVEDAVADAGHAPPEIAEERRPLHQGAEHEPRPALAEQGHHLCEGSAHPVAGGDEVGPSVGRTV